MSEIANARINSLAHVAQQAEVSPEEPIFVLTGSQLQEIITRAVQEATERLYLEIAYDRQRGSANLNKKSHNLSRRIEERSLEPC